MTKCERVKRTSENSAECRVTRKAKIETLTGEFPGSHRFCSPVCDHLIEQYRCHDDWCILFDHEVVVRARPDTGALFNLRCPKCRKVFGEMLPAETKAREEW